VGTTPAKSVLLVDDLEESRRASRRLVESLGYKVTDVSDGLAALDSAKTKKPDLLLLDVRMPGMDGFEVARRYRAEVSERTPIVMLTALDDLETRVRSIDAGANDVLTKPAERSLVAVRLRTLLEHEEKFDKLTACQQSAFALVKAVETKSKHTSGHARRTALWASKMGRDFGLSAERVAIVQAGGLLHDVGKIGVPDAILEKPSDLTPDEVDVMHTHPNLGDLIIKAGSIDPIVAQCARNHHERMDGRGYPDRLPLATLPIEVRIVQVADVFDALTSHRPYRRASPPREAIRVLRDGVADGQFEPESVAIIAELVARREIVLH
jgi:putative two-component system response regulator